MKLTLINIWFCHSLTYRYNVYNEYPGNFRYPIAIAAMQFGVGLIYAVPLWFLGIRKPPKINFDDFLLLAPIGMIDIMIYIIWKTIAKIYKITRYSCHSNPKCGRSCLHNNRDVSVWWWIPNSRPQCIGTSILLDTR